MDILWKSLKPKSCIKMVTDGLKSHFPGGKANKKPGVKRYINKILKVGKNGRVCQVYY